MRPGSGQSKGGDRPKGSSNVSPALAGRRQNFDPSPIMVKTLRRGRAPNASSPGRERVPIRALIIARQPLSSAQNRREWKSPIFGRFARISSRTRRDGWHPPICCVIVVEMQSGLHFSKPLGIKAS